MDLRRIPNYPNYGATSDGRIYSFKHKKFLKGIKYHNQEQVTLYYEGMPFKKNVGRLVFEAFYGYEPERITHRDDNVHNNQLENLIETTDRFVPQWANFKRKQNLKSCKPIKFYRLNIATKKVDIIFPSRGTTEYIHALACCSGRETSYKGHLYYKPNEKEKLIRFIEQRINTNLLLLQAETNRLFRARLKQHIANHQQRIEILREIDSYA